LSAYQLLLTSLCCGADLRRVAAGRPIAGTEVRVVAACGECGREFVITALLRPLVMNCRDKALGDGERCGTEAAYQRHLRRGEPVDAACRDAHRCRKTPTGRTGKRQTVWV
jgi:hypothetical protein